MEFKGTLKVLAALLAASLIVACVDYQGQGDAADPWAESDSFAVKEGALAACSIVDLKCQHEALLMSAKKGDILLGRFQSCTWGPVTGYWCHAALVSSPYPNFRVIEITGSGKTVTEATTDGAWKAWATPDRYVRLLRPKVDAWRRDAAPENAKLYLGKPYSWTAGKSDMSKFYCSKLVWAAYYKQAFIVAPGSTPPSPVDLDSNGGPIVFPDDFIGKADNLGVASGNW